MPPHPIEPYLAAKLADLDGLWIVTRFPQPCPTAGCAYSRNVPIALLLRKGKAREEMELGLLLRAIVCQTCRRQPERIEVAERGDLEGWKLVVPPGVWRR